MKKINKSNDSLVKKKELYERKSAELEYLNSAFKQGIDSGIGHFKSIDDLLTHARAQAYK